MLNDLRYTVRTLLKNPGFTSVVILSLALGIGANTAIFSLIDAVLLKTMPVKDPKELVQIVRIHPKWGPASLSYPAFERFRDHNQVFSGLFAVTGISSRRIQSNGQTEQADGVSVGRSPDLYLPMMMHTSFLKDPHSNWLQVIARLKPGVIQKKAQAELGTLFSQQLAEILGSDWTAFEQKEFLRQRFELIPAGTGLSDLRRQFSKPLWILMGMVALVLLTSSANVATLLLARAAARRKEIAVRLAVGASRARLIRQLLTESVLLAVLAGSLGLLFAYWTADLLVTFMSRRDAPILLDLHPDVRVLLLTAGISIVAGILFGLAPALQAASLNFVPALKQETHANVTKRFSGLGGALVSSQVAVSLFLLITAGLFVRTLQNLKTQDAGFTRENFCYSRWTPQKADTKGLASLTCTGRCRNG